MTMDRRRLLQAGGVTALSTALPNWVQAQSSDSPSASPPAAADQTIRIGNGLVELAPDRIISTTTYNGQFPGPLLRFKEGQPVTIDVTNRSPREDVVHWHGLHIPPAVDGAMEEGTPMLAPGASTRVTFTPTPAGFRWYHTHTFAGTDLKKAQYTGQHGFLLLHVVAIRPRHPRQSGRPLS